MSTNTLGLFLRHLALSGEVSRLGTASDQDLLAAYEAERGQAAFTELMRRHGPMVLRTCRRVLGHGPDAEDAFQATFVLLARKASQLCSEAAGPLSLGGWLHRVAYQTAVNVLSQLTRRRVRERQAGAMTHPDPNPVTEATWNEVRPILDAELDALPDEARRLLIACYLQEKTHAEAAAELGLPLGSLARRLEKARALLAERLVRRGITISASLVVVLLGEAASGAGVPAVLLVHTVEAARIFTEQASGTLSDNVARLVKGGLAQMAKGSTHLSMALAGWLSLVGAGLLACQTLKAWPDQKPEGEPAAAQQAMQERNKTARTDRYGDPLPPGALVRLGTVRWRHATGVQALAFTPDGKGLITAEGKKDPVRLWDVTTGRMLRRFGGGGSPIYSTAALSPDGRTLALSEADGTIRLVETASGKERGHFAGHDGNIETLSFAPDGRRLASGSSDTTILVWDLTGRFQDGRPQPAQLSDKELAKLWVDLAADGSGRAGRAIWTLAAAPTQAVPYLGERLRTSAGNAKARMGKVPQLLRDLDDDAFAVRAKARTELARLGVLVEPALRRALAKSPSVEMRRSLEQLLEAVQAEHQTPSRESLREVRALEVLEQIGTREARRALKALAAGNEPESALAQEACAALERLDRAERR